MIQYKSAPELRFTADTQAKQCAAGVYCDGRHVADVVSTMNHARGWRWRVFLDGSPVADCGQLESVFRTIRAHMTEESPC